MRWLRRIRNTFRRGSVQERARQEFDFHLRESMDDLCAGGMDEDEARREAARLLGNRTLRVEETSDASVSLGLETFLRNLRLAVRSLAKTPVFTGTVVATLALGIGANSAVFSAIDAVLLRPLPFPDSEQLVSVRQMITPSATLTGNTTGLVSPARLEDWNRLNSTFTSLTGYYTQDVSELSGELPERLVMAGVAPGLIETWGIAPLLGRGLEAADHETNGAISILISERFWRKRFGGDPDAIGKTLRIDLLNSPTIVGVMPDTFEFPVRGTDVWTPVRGIPSVRNLTWYFVTGRLRSGISVQQARANLATVQAGLAREYPDSDAGIQVQVEPLKTQVVGDAGSSLWLLFGSVSLLLLIACTNIAALLLGRATHRRNEIALRYSLGASRASVLGHQLTEALVLAVAGSAVALLVAALAAQVFRSLAGDLPRIEEIGLDGRIVLYTFACAIPVTLLCGLLPALRLARNSARSAMQEGGRWQVSARQPIQWVLVGAQVALAVTLLSGAGLFVRSLQELNRVEAGLDSSHVLSFSLTSSYAETNDFGGLRRKSEAILDSLSTTPGVEASALSIGLPGTRLTLPAEFQILERAQDVMFTADQRYIAGDYFDTLHIPLMAGGLCERNAQEDQAVVNRLFADRFLNGSEGIGMHLRSGNQPDAAIRGIVGDVRETGLDRAPVPTVYRCSASMQPGSFFLVRTGGEPDAMVRTIREKLREIEPGRSVYAVAPLQVLMEDTFQENRMRAVLVGFFALTAVLLASVGLYGTLGYFVNVRRREIGVRLALGAKPKQILRQFLSQGLRVALVGAVLGLAMALAGSRLLQGMLFGVSPNDPATLAAVIGLVLAVTSAASLVPAFRASRVRPMKVLREE